MTKKQLFTSMVAAIYCSIQSFAAEIGKPAPDINVKDAKGEAVSLAALKGKVVVLEWNNFACPFVKKHYDSKNMQGLQEKYTGKGVVWLTINSSNPSNTAAYLSSADFIKAADAQGSKASHLIVDAKGEIGKAYAAKTTPHMIVIDQAGNLAYDGAIDSKKSTDAADIASSENYVSAALDAVLENKPVAKSKTEPYGCGVKY